VFDAVIRPAVDAAGSVWLTIVSGSSGQEQFEDVYSGGGGRAPKERLPDREVDPRIAYSLVHDELMLDGVSRMNLATFCTTWAEPEVHRLLDEALDRNIVDKDEYPQTAELERRCVRMVGDLWHAPGAGEPTGTSTTGSSEAAMLGGLAAKWRWRKQLEAAGKRASQPNFVCGPVQVCWEKFARYFDVEKREVAMADGRFVMSPEESVSRCDENTIAVVVTFGQTFTGLYEDVCEIARALDELQERTGLDVPIHVDAASGGFLAPFVAPELVWDFRLPRVRSINASGHKMGLAPLGCGWALWREKSDLPEELIFNVNYLGGDYPTFNLNFSRPAGPVIAQYYDFVRLGREGYRRVQSACYTTARYLAEELERMALFEVVFDGDPSRGICAVCWRLRADAGVGFNLFDLADRLRTQGWLVPAYALPANCEDVVVQRILVRHGVSRDLAELLVGDLQRALELLAGHPPSRSLNAREAGGFNHDASPAAR
jgi:glutamate decarboxylase